LAEILLPTPAELRQQFLDDVSLEAIRTGNAEPPIGPGSEWHLLGTGLANLCAIGLQNIAIGVDNQDPRHATGQALQDMRAPMGLPVLPPAGSSGSIVVTVLASATIPEGAQLTLPNDLRVEVSQQYINPGNGSEVKVRAIDVGKATNFPAGSVVEFAGSPPPGIAAVALVSQGDPLTGGRDAETEEELRQRILNRLENPPGGANWSQMREDALQADRSVQDVFIYPALGGPASVAVVCMRAIDANEEIFTRECTDNQIQRIQDALHAKYSSAHEVVVRTVTDQSADFTFQITVPNSTLSGGDGTGWLDSTPWPVLETADGGNVAIASVAQGGRVVEVDAETSVAPVALQTHVAWWSTADKRFYVGLVVSVAGSAGSWSLTLQEPLVDSSGDTPGVGDFISPAAVNIQNYGARFLEVFNALGPGENTANVDILQRGKRFPAISRTRPNNWTDGLMGAVTQAHGEIGALTRAYGPTTSPDIPDSVDDSPNILHPRHLGFYPSS
jgi:hypothetical protein